MISRVSVVVAGTAAEVELCVVREVAVRLPHVMYVLAGFIVDVKVVM